MGKTADGKRGSRFPRATQGSEPRSLVCPLPMTPNPTLRGFRGVVGCALADNLVGAGLCARGPPELGRTGRGVEGGLVVGEGRSEGRLEV